MIWSFIKKQILLMIRNRENFTLLLVMPVVLIAIIRFAVGDMMDQEEFELDATVAIVEHSNEAEDINQVIEEIMALPIEENDKQAILTSINSFLPIQLMKEKVFGNDEIKNMIKLEEISPDQVDAAKEQETYEVIIEVPENFSYHLLKSSFDNKEKVPKLTLYANKSEQFTTQIVRDILLTYEDQIKTNMVMGKYDLENLIVTPQDLNITTSSVTKLNPITSTLYYAVGMSVMFVLYISSTIGTYAYDEKRIHVFDRIILANISRWTYFSGTFFSGTILAFVQLMILFGFSAVAFGVTWPNLSSFLLVSFFISCTIGSIASILTAINYRFHSEAASNIFSNVIVSTLALIGGSFFPISSVSKFFQFIANLTPNGAGLTSYLSIAQGYGVNEIMDHLFYLLAFSVIVMAAAIFIMPKRGHEA